MGSAGEDDGIMTRVDPHIYPTELLNYRAFWRIIYFVDDPLITCSTHSTTR